MRRVLLLLTFVYIVCLVQTVEARKLALLVGVDDYATVSKLKCCVNDVKTLKGALLKIGFEEDDIQMLVTGVSEFSNLPTKKNIERNISKMLSNVQPSDMVFIAFSGHGMQEGGNVYFCPPDVEVEDIEGTCVSINKVMANLAKCKAKFKWLVVDACRNDPNQGPKGIGGKGLRVIPAPPAGIALFQSCAEGEESWEDVNSGNGYFTKNFAVALSGEADANHDGKLTLMEVCTWTTAHTKEQVKKSQNKIQRPFFSGSVSDFTLSENMNVPKAKALVEEARIAVEEEEYELAVQKYDEAIALCPRFSSIRRERNIANTMLKMSQNMRVGKRPVKPSAPQRQPSAPQRPASAQPSAPQRPVPVISPDQAMMLNKPGAKAGEKRTVTVNGVVFSFRWCPPGTFKMGSPDTEPGRYDGETQHQVTLTKGFWMMETEVTQKQWIAVMGNLTDCGFKGDNLPVQRVSWNDCQEFCKRFAQLGLPVGLPTEAQWEYACRAGTTGIFAGKLDKIAWYNLNSGGDIIHQVGRKTPNAWGLYDMNGNVWEWCQDWKDDYPSESVKDPAGPSKGAYRVKRGGSWRSSARDCRSACRDILKENYIRIDVGFRVVRTISSPKK